ncbi:MAG: iron complex outermembrane recepter [Prolixibacteraceae bacterium]|nr:MAG: iron complex outermembrane recepter [Prolixibacteraceae bacterium]
MKLIQFCILMFTINLSFLNYLKSQEKSDAVITGHVVSKGEHIPFVNIYLENTTMGTTTDITGHYMLVDVPVGKFTIVAKMIGYKIQKKEIETQVNQTIEVKFELEEEFIRVDEVVITGTKTFKRQTESAVIVGVMDSRAIENVAAQTVSESLNFQPGLRMEIDCQTCNYSQLRMNGLGGAYSQILVNSRSVFSPLTGLYGLEQMPTEMVERIEIVRGGASALYGSSAIGGTVNIITRMPQRNSYKVTLNESVVGSSANDFSVNGTLTALSQKRNAGMALYTSHRQRDWYDHNGDNFSELPALNNNSFGINSFFNLDENQKVEASFSSLHEYRYGGEMLDGAAYLAEQSEERTHNILTGGIDYTLTSDNNQTSFVVYAAGQNTNRNHFTGISPDNEAGKAEYFANPPYGTSKNHTIQFGTQLNHTLYSFLLGVNVLTFGAEYLVDDVYDEIKTYNYLTDQNSRNFGTFLQSDWTVSQKITLLTGVRADKHNFVDDMIFNPRVSFLFKPNTNAQLRLSWSTGFRAPQAFDSDMHIAFAGGGIQTVELADDLKEERSQSWTTSFNWDKPTEFHIYGFTVEGFYTLLKEAFILQETGTDADGNSLMQKQNGGKSHVTGATLEFRANYNRKLQAEAGITIQQSLYNEPVQWSEELPGVKDYLRSPNSYGYYTLTWTPTQKFKTTLSGIYTGSMLVPHYGVPGYAGNIQNDILFESPKFWETNLKISYTATAHRLDSSVEFFGGVGNIFNQYQNDFDSGKYRDSGYIYGPSKPRNFYVGIKIFN